MSFQHPYACPQHQTGKKLDIIYTGSQTDDPRTGSVQKIAHFFSSFCRSQQYNEQNSFTYGGLPPPCGERERKRFTLFGAAFESPKKKIQLQGLKLED